MIHWQEKFWHVKVKMECFINDDTVAERSTVRLEMEMEFDLHAPADFIGGFIKQCVRDTHPDWDVFEYEATEI